MADGVTILWRLVGPVSGRTGCGADARDPSTGCLYPAWLQETAKLAFGWMMTAGMEVRTVK